MAKVKDQYQIWIELGKLDEIMEFIKECSRKMVSQNEMCLYLGINPKSFINLKTKYPEIGKAQELAKLDLKRDLMNALYKKAVGFELTEETTYIEDEGKGKAPKRKITKVKKQVAPDKYCIVYLLTKNFGVEFYDRSYELSLMEEKLIEKKEVWKK